MENYREILKYYNNVKLQRNIISMENYKEIL